jgi:hypothetical protein
MWVDIGDTGELAIDRLYTKMFTLFPPRPARLLTATALKAMTAYPTLCSR